MRFLKHPVILAVTASCLPVFATWSAAQDTVAPPRRVVLIVWDGLRPDSVTDETTPTLAKLAREGVFFTRHHSVYPTSTEVNGTAMMTGCYPGHSGLIANREYRPAIEPLKTIAMEDLAAIRKGDEISGGHYLRVPTLPELLQRAGQRTVIAGTKPVVVLFDRAVRDNDADAPVLFEGNTLPPNLAPLLAEPSGGAFPKEIHFPNADEDAWTTKALIHALWKPGADGVPRLTVLWMSDPDYTQHQFGPDTPGAKRALASVDARLADVLADLDARHLRDSTDVLVVSDHGFSTIGRGVDVAKALADAGFRTAREYKAPPKSGDVLVDGLGGTVFLYVAEHDQDTVRRLVDFLQKSNFAGVIFTRNPLPGTFELSQARIDSPDAPDIALAMRWSDDKNATGFPGAVVSDGSRKPGQGTHASLSAYDLHNTLVAAGPDFRRDWRDPLPSGNVDIAPTIDYLLGLKDAPNMDGRVLSESFKAAEGQPDPILPAADHIDTLRDSEDGLWSQYLDVVRFGGVDYIDQGNAVLPAK